MSSADDTSIPDGLKETRTSGRNIVKSGPNISWPICVLSLGTYAGVVTLAIIYDGQVTTAAIALAGVLMTSMGFSGVLNTLGLEVRKK